MQESFNMSDSSYYPNKTVCQIQVLDLMSETLEKENFCFLNLKGVLYPVKYAIHHSMLIAGGMTIDKHQLNFTSQLTNLLP